jgi:hypothetical protein
MPFLFSKIESEITQETLVNIVTNNQILTKVGQEDYIETYGLIAYLQNFKNT